MLKILKYKKVASSIVEITVMSYVYQLSHKTILLSLIVTLLIGCSNKKFKGYDKYYLGEKIENKSIFKSIFSESDGIHNYYMRIEILPNGSTSKLTFKTTDDILTGIKLFVGKPDYETSNPLFQIARFKNYCSYTEKQELLSLLRKKYGQETDSVYDHWDGYIDNFYTHKWRMDGYAISLEYRVKEYSPDVKAYNEKTYGYDQKADNSLTIEYSLNSEEEKKYEQNMKKKNDEKNDKF